MSKPPMPDPLHVLELKVEKLQVLLRWAMRRVQPLPADSADMEGYRDIQKIARDLVAENTP